MTAAALQQTPQGITVWLAANENIGDNVLHFLREILSDIRRIANVDDSQSRQREGEQTEEDLITRIVAFNAPRIQTYYGQVARKHVPACLDTIGRKLVKSGTSNIAFVFALLPSCFGLR